jgi:hypothetical protein
LLGGDIMLPGGESALRTKLNPGRPGKSGLAVRAAYKTGVRTAQLILRDALAAARSEAETTASSPVLEQRAAS